MKHWWLVALPLVGAIGVLFTPRQAHGTLRVATLILMFVILSVSTGAKEKGITAGIAVGAVIALEAMFAGPVCGASMNPARSIAPALVGAHFEHLWLYVVGPSLGALLAVPVCCAIRPQDCCGAAANQDREEAFA